jgi:hypothetical protein
MPVVKRHVIGLFKGPENSPLGAVNLAGDLLSWNIAGDNTLTKI